MGKWTAFKKVLPAVPVDGAYQAKVDVVKAEFADKPLAELTKAYDEVNGHKAEAEKEIKEMNVQLEALEQLLVSRLEDLGLTSVRVDGGGSFLLTDEPYASVADRAKCREWFEEKDQRELLAPHPSTLKALIKSRLEAGEDPDVVGREMGVKIFMKTGLQRRKH